MCILGINAAFVIRESGETGFLVFYLRIVRFLVLYLQSVGFLLLQLHIVGFLVLYLRYAVSWKTLAMLVVVHMTTILEITLLFNFPVTYKI